MFGRRTASQALVVGAGPVGLFAALGLARRGVDVAIIDSQWRTAARSYALALHPRTLSLFDQAGLAEPLLAQGRRIDRVDYCDRGGRQETIDFGRLESKFPFVLVMPQHLLESALENQLAEQGVDVMWSHRLVALEESEAGVRATVQRLGKESTGYSVSSTEWVVEKTTGFDSGFVLGADGHSSAVRRLAEISLDEVAPSQRFAVFECSADQPGEDRMQVVLDDVGTAVYWPLPANRFRWSFELSGEEAVPERSKRRLAVQVGETSLPYLSDENLGRLLDQRAPWFDTEVAEIHWSVAVRFEHRLASEFGRGRVSLIGDAAHLAGPIGVQSMNAGLEEATVLAELVAETVKGKKPREPIAAYDDRRRAEWQRLSRLPLSAAEAAPDWVRQRSARLPACIPAWGKDLEALAGQLNLELPSSP